MKKILLLASAATMIAAACACQKIEEKVVSSGINVTATINESDITKVGYSIVSETVHPVWEVDDQIFGFSESGNVTYKVSSVTAGGVASFEYVSGTQPAEGQTTYMIYSPAQSASNISSQTVAVDLGTQDGTLASLKNHAIMCATATVSGGNLHLAFSHQAAIVGVKKFSGLAASTTYTKLTFTTSGPIATVKVDGGTLKMVADGDFGQVTLNGTFTTDASGNFETPVYIAVPACSAVCHTFAMHSASDHRAGGLSSKALEAGKYYEMASKAMKPVIYFNDFESETTGTLPSGWYLTHDGTGTADQVVIDSKAKYGTKSFQEKGKSSWACDNYYSFTSSNDVITLEAYYYQESYTTDLTEACLGFGNWYSRLINRYGNSYATGEDVTSGTSYILQKDTYTRNTWHHMRMQATKTTNTYRVWIDGVAMMGSKYSDSSTKTMDFPAGASWSCLNCIMLNSGHGATSLFDEILCY